MTLPRVDVPTYELTLPSQDLKVKFRPFLVKEEKILYIAQETGDNKQIVGAIKDIINACTFNTLKVDELPIFDVEYIFLQLRAKSVSEISKFKTICPDDGKTYVETEIDLTKVEVQVDDKHTNKIILDENRNLGIVFKYPTLKNYDYIKGKIDTQQLETMFKILIDCVDHIFEGDKIYSAKDSTTKELKDFLEGLPQEVFVKVKAFFETMPTLKHEIEVLNPKTNVKNKIVLTGISDFFE